MRKLTIHREKCFAGSLSTQKVYIEDTISPELTIADIPCRKLGTLKNGQEKTFEISENAARVFVVAGKASKNYCGDSRAIPAGSDDVVLRGKNGYDPARGNAFCFDGEADAQTVEYRKSGTKKGLIIMVACVIIGSLVGYLGNRAYVVRPKEFSSNGMTITLTNEFTENEDEEYTAYYSSSRAGIFIQREGFDLVPEFEDITLEEYYELLLMSNPAGSASELQEEDGVVFFEYEQPATETGKQYMDLVAIYRTDDAFWFVDFMAHEKNYDKCRAQFLNWASSVTFADD